MLVDDLSREDSLSFLMSPSMESRNTDKKGVSLETATKIHDIVGGRIHHLLRFKRDSTNGIDFATTRDNLLTKERSKFINIKQTKDMWSLIQFMWSQPNHMCQVSSALKKFLSDAIDECLKRNILKLTRGSDGITLMFESRLTEVTLSSMLSGN